MNPHIPYRITIGLAIGPRGKTIVVTGETPDMTAGDHTEANYCALAANALVWQSHAMAQAATDYAQFARLVRSLNLPIPPMVM